MDSQTLFCVPLLYPLGSRQGRKSIADIFNLYGPTVFLTSHYPQAMAITREKTLFNSLRGHSNSLKKP